MHSCPIVLPDIDLGALRKAIPGLTEIDLPSMQEAGKRADEAVDQLLGRSRPPIMPLLALGVILIALSGWAAALLTWRRSDSTRIAFMRLTMRRQPTAGGERCCKQQWSSTSSGRASSANAARCISGGEGSTWQ